MREKVLLIGDTALVTLAQTLPGFQTFTPVLEVNLATLQAHLTSANITILLLREWLDIRFVTELDDFCQQFGIDWAQFHLDAGAAWLGPLILPGKTACYHDLLARRLGVAAGPEEHHALVAPPFTQTYTGQLASANELCWALAIFAREIENWLTSQTCSLLSVERKADLLTLQLTDYPILPLPERPLVGPLQMSIHEPEALLVNERSGIIIRTQPVTHAPFIPAALKTVQAHLACMRWQYPGWGADLICGGSAFFDEEAARQAAIGESIERYCGGSLPYLLCRSDREENGPIWSSYQALVARGEHATDPALFSLLSAAHYAKPGCPFVPFERDTPVYWVKGRSLTKDCPAWLPLSFVYSNWRSGPFANAPLTNWLNYSGIACGPSLDAAIMSGIEEIVERDATMIWWLNRQPLPAMQATPALTALWDGAPAAAGQRAWLISLPNPFNLPVMAGVVENTQQNLLTIGFACRPNPEQAARKAWTEALVLEETACDLDLATGKTYQAVRDGWLPNALKPWRADRAYLDDYAPDFADVQHLLTQLQVALDPRLLQKIRQWVDTPQTMKFEDVPALPARALSLYQQRIEAAGHEIFYVDLTTPDVLCTGLKVARVMIPGLVPNAPAAFLPIGTGRVQNMAVQLGWHSTPLPEADLNTLPMPHA